jgi:glycosyltransferase involved in cell wall biosynthesis
VGTWEENQACVVQEAMLAQALVIASQTGGVPESLAPELRPFLVPEGDARAIAAAVVAIGAYDIPLLRQLGMAARRFAVGRYDIRNLNSQILQESLAARPEVRAAG